MVTVLKHTNSCYISVELQYYLRLVEPSLVCCDEATQATVADAVADTADVNTDVLRLDTNEFMEYIKGYSDDIDSFTYV